MAPNDLAGNGVQGDGSGKPNQNAKKKDLAEAGRRKLEEFRRKKAGGGNTGPKKSPTGTSPSVPTLPAAPPPLTQVPTNHESLASPEITTPPPKTPESTSPFLPSPSPSPFTTPKEPLRAPHFLTPSPAPTEVGPPPPPPTENNSSASSYNVKDNNIPHAKSASIPPPFSSAPPSHLFPPLTTQPTDRPRSMPFGSGPLFASRPEAMPFSAPPPPGFSREQHHARPALNVNSNPNPPPSVPTFRPPPPTFFNPRAPPPFSSLEVSRASASLGSASPQSTSFIPQWPGTSINSGARTADSMGSSSSTPSSLPDTASSRLRPFSNPASAVALPLEHSGPAAPAPGRMSLDSQDGIRSSDVNLEAKAEPPPTSRTSSLWSFVAPMPAPKQITKPVGPLARPAPDASVLTPSDPPQTSLEPTPLPQPPHPSTTNNTPPQKPLLPPPSSESIAPKTLKPDPPQHVNNDPPPLATSSLELNPKPLPPPSTSLPTTVPRVLSSAPPSLPDPRMDPSNGDTWHAPVPASLAFSSHQNPDPNSAAAKPFQTTEHPSDTTGPTTTAIVTPTSKPTMLPTASSSTRAASLDPPAPPSQRPALPPPRPALIRDSINSKNSNDSNAKPSRASGLQPSPLRPSLPPPPPPPLSSSSKAEDLSGEKKAGGFDLVGLLSSARQEGEALPVVSSASAIAARGAEVDRSRKRGGVPPPAGQAAALPPPSGERAAKEGPAMNGRGSRGGGAQWGSEFGQLEQHIEDLTKEKYALQRGLDAARTLAESLANENEALTETFNRQGQVVAQLQAEIDKLGEEIQAQKVVVEAAREERERAVGESAANTERARALASENVALEEKILRLRSNELKLERDIQSLKGDIEGWKRTVAMMDKDRSSMRSTIEALQEDKRGLQVRLRKAALGGVLESVRGPQTTRAEASTSTDDLAPPMPSAPPAPAANGAAETSTGPHLPSPTSSETIPLEDEPSTSSSTGPPRQPSPGSGAAAEARPELIPQRTSLGLRARSNSFSIADLSSIPDDEARTIENINRLITELTEERRAVHTALQAEVASSAELRTANAELSRKLAIQTQRLELQVAQSMARQSNGESVTNTPREDAIDYTPEYMDENDEVVERVLGWIMRLIPGGSSKRSLEKRA